MLITEPHHDGSPLYVSDSGPKPGEKVTLSVRIPNSYPTTQVYVRIYHDGEARYFPLKQDHSAKSKTESWWRAKIEMMNEFNSYRFLIANGTEYTWLTAAGMRDFEPNSNTDFRLIARPKYPQWISERVFYQIFPDRFATSGKKRPLPDWAIPQEWEAAHQGKYKSGGQDFYGGDFAGIESKLPYLQELGVGGIYFTPIFPSRSNHRYDAISFDHVDPLLGGDKEFLSFLKSTRKKKIKVIIDLTTNHVGVGHTWFEKAKKAKSSSKSKERGYFFWDKKSPFGYIGWFGLASLPKLNFASKQLRTALYQGKSSAFQRWLRAPFSLDGWRIDVGNMTGLYRDEDHHDGVVREIREVIDVVNPNAWLVAENADMQTKDLDGSSWHGTMNYQGFARPLWSWINKNADVKPGGQGMPVDMPVISTDQFVKTMREFNGGIPWRSLVASMNLLDSHDTARMRNIVGGDRSLHLSAMTLLLTYPGVPSIFAGDELGMEGAWGEDARRPIQWAHPESWDHEFLDATKSLIALRSTSQALAHGGLRFLSVEKDHFIFIREVKGESIFVVISRNPLASLKSETITPKGFGLEGYISFFDAEAAQIWRKQG